MVGYAPNKNILQKGRPFSDATGELLRKELGYCGINLYSLRLCYLWQHLENGVQSCKMHGISVVSKEAAKCKLVVLIGNDLSKLFCNIDSVSANGLVLKSAYFSALVMVCISPDSVFHGGVGELRFGIRKFVEKAQEMKLL